MSVKYKETCFTDYLQAMKTSDLHPQVSKSYSKFPNSLCDIPNVIVYGPPGTGKYTQVLKLLERYSPSGLKYEKKLSFSLPKQTYHVKMSDIHYEVDFTVLGCNSKILWHDLYTQILDSIAAKPDKTGVIVCKYFHCVHNELLDSFYSYMQELRPVRLCVKFVFATEQISFLPDNILDCCYHVNVPRPSKAAYGRCCGARMAGVQPCQVTNIKTIDRISVSPMKIFCDDIVSHVVNYETIKFGALRDKLYNILILDLDLTECVWTIFTELIHSGHITAEMVPRLTERFYKIFHRYNNNYRPIMHLESFVFTLVTTIHGLGESQGHSGSSDKL
jgi:Cdc6-like AAA superfamily ATPase